MEISFDRFRALEDKIEIYQIISLFNAAADSSNLDILHDIWHEDCELIYGIREGNSASDYGKLTGHAGLDSVVHGEAHQAFMASGSAHVNSLPHVQISGDRAAATTYQILHMNENGRFVVHTTSANRWEFARTDKGWKITKRTTESMHGGNQRAQDLLFRVRDVE